MRCPAASNSRGTKIPHCSHNGLGLVTSLKMAIVSLIWKCMKFNQRLEMLVDLPVNPSTGKLIVVAVCGKATRYSVGVVQSGTAGNA